MPDWINRVNRKEITPRSWRTGGLSIGGAHDQTGIFVSEAGLYTLGVSYVKNRLSAREYSFDPTRKERKLRRVLLNDIHVPLGLLTPDSR